MTTKESEIAGETNGNTHGLELLSSNTNKNGYKTLDGSDEIHDDNIHYRKQSIIQDFMVQSKASVFSSGINLCNTNIGIGVLSLANGVSDAGWFLGTILFILFGILSGFAMNLLMSIGRTFKNEKASYALVCDKIIPWLGICFDIVLIIGWFMVEVAYFIVIGDYMPLVAKELNIIDDRTFWILLFAIVLITPTTLLRKLDALRFVSILAILCFIYLIIVVFLYAPNISDKMDPINEDNIDKEVLMFPPDVFSFFKAAPLFIFAFGGHPLAFALSNELENNTQIRINQTITWSYSFVTIVYSSAGLLGYFTFGDKVSSNILVDYPNSDIPIIILRILLCIAISFSYPVLANGWKDSVASLIFKTHKEGKDAKDLPTHKYLFIVSLLIISSIMTALIFDDLGLVARFTGATVGCVLQLIVPGLLYFYSDRLDTNELRDNSYHEIKKKGAFCLVIFGIIMIPFGVTLIFVN